MKLEEIQAVSVGSDIYVLGCAEQPGTMVKFCTAVYMWSTVAPLPELILEPLVCIVGSHMYAFGGLNSHEDEQGSMFKYDTVTAVWSTLAPMPQVCGIHCVSLADGRVYILRGGGSGQEGLCFDPVTDT